MKYDAVIVGAGIIGLATAERLLKQGMNVKLLERGKVGREASWAGGGILSPLCPWDYSNAVTCLAQYGAKLYPAWTSTLRKETGIDSEYHQCGMFVLPPYDLKKAELWCKNNNVAIRQQEVAVPFSTEKNSKITQHRNIVRAIFLSGIAQVRNPKLLDALQQRIIQLGGEIVENCTVHDFTIKQNKVESIQSSCGQFMAEKIIIAAGSWSKAVLGKYALNLEIWPLNGQMLLFKFDSPPFSTVLLKDGIYFIPRKDGHLLVGSTLEDTGFNRQVTASTRNYLLSKAKMLFPQLSRMPIKRQWSGLRPASPQNIPTICQHPILDNLYLNSGHFRYGVTMAPASAEIMSNIITGAPQPFDILSYQTNWHN